MRKILAATSVLLAIVSTTLPALARSGFDPDRTDSSRRNWVEQVFKPLGGAGGSE